MLSSQVPGQAAALPVHSTENAAGLPLNAAALTKASSLLLLQYVGKATLYQASVKEFGQESHQHSHSLKYTLQIKVPSLRVPRLLDSITFFATVFPTSIVFSVAVCSPVMKSLGKKI